MVTVCAKPYLHKLLTSASVARCDAVYIRLETANLSNTRVQDGDAFVEL